MRPKERRSAGRFARRAQVRYWIKGNPKPQSAFVKDVSETGIFIATPYPLRRGTEIYLEVQWEGQLVAFEAVVARKVWIAPDLRKLGLTGMGAEFLSPEKLVARLMGTGHEQTQRRRDWDNGGPAGGPSTGGAKGRMRMTPICEA